MVQLACLYHIPFFLLLLPNGKLLQYSNNLYYGSSKTRVATNSQISSLQSQINTINENQLLKQTIVSKNIIFNETVSSSGLNVTKLIYTMPNNIISAFIYLGRPTGNYNLQSSSQVSVTCRLKINENDFIGNSTYGRIVNSSSSTASGSSYLEWMLTLLVENYGQNISHRIQQKQRFRDTSNFVDEGMLNNFTLNNSVLSLTIINTGLNAGSINVTIPVYISYFT